MDYDGTLNEIGKSIHKFNDLLEKLRQEHRGYAAMRGIKEGQWGKFWDDYKEKCTYGELTKIDPRDGESSYLCGGNTWFLYFEPIPGLKEAIQDKER